MISIVDYGMGNLRSVEKGFLKVGVRSQITSNPEEILGSGGVVLPGVGAFGACMENLERYGLVEPLVEYIKSGNPFLGICLGLQLLFEESEESPGVKGLGVLKGRVKRFPQITNGIAPLKIPHMGWNRVSFNKESPIYKGIPEGSRFYFVHSYYTEPQDRDVALCTTDYGFEFISAVGKGNLYAMQFHPEKSSALGLQILKNFGELVSGHA